MNKPLGLCLFLAVLYGCTRSSSAPYQQAPSLHARSLYQGMFLLTEGEAIPQPDFNTEEYDRIDDIGFRSPRVSPLSTFSIDVDTASYSNARRFINDSALPPKDAVRIEEFINYFNYSYPEPEDEQPLSITTEVAECPWNPAHRLALIGLQGKKVATADLPDSNLVFLLDVSGSMDSPVKLPLLKQAFRLLVEQLGPRDRVSIVVYAGAAGMVLPPTTGDKKETILAAIDNLEAGGTTAGGEGIVQAYRVARDNFIAGGNNRVILATDGDFNVGVSSDGELFRLIEKEREGGIFLTVLGFGTGNIKDSKMEGLADRGNGNYAYIDGVLEAKKVLVSEMGGTLLTIAKDVKIQVEFNPAQVKGYRLIGYVNRMLADEDFADDRKDAGELGAGHTVTALYEIIPAGSEEDVPVPADLKYQTAAVSEKGMESGELMTVKLRYKLPEGTESILISLPVNDDDSPLSEASADFRFAAAVAEFGLLLRDSEFKGKSTYDQVLELASGAKGDDPEGYRAEFIRIVEAAQILAKKSD